MTIIFSFLFNCSHFFCFLRFFELILLFYFGESKWRHFSTDFAFFAVLLLDFEKVIMIVSCLRSLYLKDQFKEMFNHIGVRTPLFVSSCLIFVGTAYDYIFSLLNIDSCQIYLYSLKLFDLYSARCYPLHRYKFQKVY